MRWLVLAGAALALAPLGGCDSPMGAANGIAEAAAERIPLQISTAQGVRSFRVEVARTAAEQQKGLMYRTELPEDGGMLFPSDLPTPRSFWMKNTLISLDIIFIREDGSIARIAEETVPQSLEPVTVAEPVIAVLELAGGKAAALGIAEGDQVTWQGGPALPR